MSKMSKTLPLFLGLGLLGCKHKVFIDSVPAGASLSVNGELVGATPQEITVVWQPWSEIELVASAQGYRSLRIALEDDLSLWGLTKEFLLLRWGRALGLRVRSEHELLFIREHGASGTWSAEDARRN
jgi:hypothetical protein